MRGGKSSDSVQRHGAQSCCCFSFGSLFSHSVFSLLRLGLVQEGRPGYTNRRIVAKRSKPYVGVVRGVQCASKWQWRGSVRGCKDARMRGCEGGGRGTGRRRLLCNERQNTEEEGYAVGEDGAVCRGASDMSSPGMSRTGRRKQEVAGWWRFADTGAEKQSPETRRRGANLRGLERVGVQK